MSEAEENWDDVAAQLRDRLFNLDLQHAARVDLEFKVGDLWYRLGRLAGEVEE